MLWSAEQSYERIFLQHIQPRAAIRAPGDMFLKNRSWFGAMDYEWRSGPRPEEGGFWVLLWSRNPQQLWWELRDEFERKALKLPPPSDSSAWLLGLSPR